MEGKFIRGKRQEGRSKVYLTPIFHNARWFMYTPSKLYAMSLLSSSTVTAFGNYFCVHILFYSSFSLPLPPPLRFIQSKPFSSWVPTALSPHCTGSKFQFASKGEGKTWAEGLHQDIMGDMGKISDSRFFRCWRCWGWKKCRSIMAKRLRTTAACVAMLFFSSNSKRVVQAGRKAFQGWKGQSSLFRHRQIRGPVGPYKLLPKAVEFYTYSWCLFWDWPSPGWI